MSWKYITIVIVLVVIVGGGIFAWQYFKAPEKKAKILEERAQEETTIDKTATWKIYRNEEYGFEIKYPINWFTGEENQKRYRLSISYPMDIEESPGSYGMVVVEFIDAGDDEKFFEEQVNLLENATNICCNSTIEEIVIDNVNGVKAFIKYPLSNVILFNDKTKNGILRIVTYWADSEQNFYQKQTEEIISTFKFSK